MGGDIGPVDLIELREDTVLTTVFLLQLGESGGDGFQFGGELVYRRLFLRVVAGNNEGLRDEVAGPAPVLLLALLVGLDDAIGLGLPAIGSDQIAIVLHGFRPVVHQVLVDVIWLNKRL